MPKVDDSVVASDKNAPLEDEESSVDDALQDEAATAEDGAPEPDDGNDAVSAQEGSPDYVVPAPILEADPDPEGLIAIKNLEERRKKERRKRILKIVVVCAIVALAIAAYALSNAMNGASDQAADAPETAVVTKGKLTSSVQVTGSLKPESQVAVTPEVSGIIQDVLVKEGQRVEKGDILFVLKNADLEKAVDDAQAAINKARHGVDAAQTSASDARDVYYAAKSTSRKQTSAQKKAVSRAKEKAKKARERAYKVACAAIPDSATKKERILLKAQARQIARDAYKEALAVAGVSAGSTAGGSSANALEFTSTINSADAGVTTAQDALADAEREYEYALQEADKRNVKAPASGTIMALDAVAGAAVGGAKGGTEVAEGALAYVSDLSTLGVDVEVNEIDIANVEAGQKTQVTFPAIPGLTLKGKVTSVASMATSSGSDSAQAGGIVTFKVTTVVKSTDERLKPGMSANVSIITKSVPRVLIVPESALVEDETGAHVVVVTDPQTNATETRDVVVADRTDSEIGIASGLAEGEVVIADQTSAGLGMGATSSAL